MKARFRIFGIYHSVKIFLLTLALTEEEILRFAAGTMKVKIETMKASFRLFGNYHSVKIFLLTLAPTEEEVLRFAAGTIWWPLPRHSLTIGGRIKIVF